jgi:hypothetical protein
MHMRGAQTGGCSDIRVHLRFVVCQIQVVFDLSRNQRCANRTAQGTMNGLFNLTSAPLAHLAGCLPLHAWLMPAGPTTLCQVWFCLGAWWIRESLAGRGE